VQSGLIHSISYEGRRARDSVLTRHNCHELGKFKIAQVSATMCSQSEAESAAGRDAASLLASLHKAYKLMKSKSPSIGHYTEVIAVLCVLKYKGFRQVGFLF
jgi:hypothetical protein